MGPAHTPLGSGCTEQHRELYRYKDRNFSLIVNRKTEKVQLFSECVLKRVNTK